MRYENIGDLKCNNANKYTIRSGAYYSCGTNINNNGKP